MDENAFYVIIRLFAHPCNQISAHPAMKFTEEFSVEAIIDKIIHSTSLFQNKNYRKYKWLVVLKFLNLGFIKVISFFFMSWLFCNSVKRTSSYSLQKCWEANFHFYFLA